MLIVASAAVAVEARIALAIVARTEREAVHWTMS
jgi:hypothetical protein